MSSHDHIALPLGPGRLRVTATYRAYREHGRTAATMAAYGHLHGWLTGALRTTVDGQRWVNVQVPGTRRLRRFAGGTAEAIVLFVRWWRSPRRSPSTFAASRRTSPS